MARLVGMTESDIRGVAHDKSAPASKRLAAKSILRAMASPDMADFEDVVKGDVNLKDLRSAGIDTKAVKKLGKQMIELHDWFSEIDRVMDRTQGKATTPGETSVGGSVTIKQYVNVQIDKV